MKIIGVEKWSVHTFFILISDWKIYFQKLETLYFSNILKCILFSMNKINVDMGKVAEMNKNVRHVYDVTVAFVRNEQ